MCHMLLSDILQEQADKYKLKKPDGKTCGECDNFREDDSFNWLIGKCLIKNVYVYRNQPCTYQENIS